MGKQEKTIDLKLNTTGVVLGVKGVKAALSGLDRVLTSISQSLQDAFSVKGFTDYTETVSRFGKRLADDLLVLQLNFGKLKVAIADAAAPIAGVLAPWLNELVRKAIEVANTVGGVLQLVMGNRAVAESAQEAAKAENKLVSTVKAARRSLMGIDQIQRLNAPTGGARSQTEGPEPYSPRPVSDKAKAIAQQILALLEPLKSINFAPLTQALEKLKTSFQTLGQVVGQALKWLWFEVLTPFLTWVAEQFAPVFVELWSAAMNTAAAVLQPVMAGIRNLWTALQPVVSFIGTGVVTALKLWQTAFEDLGAVFVAHSPQITGILTNIGTVLSQVWNLVSPILESLRQKFAGVFTQVSRVVANAAAGILRALYDVSEFLAGGFTGNWKRCWDGIKLYFRDMINSLIGLLNSLISRLGSALNSVITAANQLRFTVPDWVPGIGGNSFGFNMPKISVPQIPYLAQGAVLPANKPFLAMLGDQKSGTNVEAPLTTIQEAVGLVMQDQTAAIMAGFSASVGVQKEILEAVLGIEIGDAVIGAAAERYNRRQAMIRGGAL